jgi:hypothetical protein
MDQKARHLRLRQIHTKMMKRESNANKKIKMVKRKLIYSFLCRRMTPQRFEVRNKINKIYFIIRKSAE